MHTAEFTLELSTRTLSLLCKVSIHLFSGSQVVVVCFLTDFLFSLSVSLPSGPHPICDLDPSNEESCIVFGAIFHSSLAFKWQAGQSCSLSAVVCILDPGFMRQHTWLVNVQLPLLICSDISQPEITASPVWLVTYRTPLLHWETMVVCALKIPARDSSATVVGPLGWDLCRGWGGSLKETAIERPITLISRGCHLLFPWALRTFSLQSTRSPVPLAVQRLSLTLIQQFNSLVDLLRHPQQ